MICAVIEKISPCLKAASFSNSWICTASLLSWSCFLMNSSFSFFISLPDLCPSLPLLPVLQSPWLYNHMLDSSNIDLSSSKPTFLSSCCLEIFFSAFRTDCFWFWTAKSLLLSFTNSWLWPGTLIRKSAGNVLQGRWFRWVEILSIRWEDYRRYGSTSETNKTDNSTKKLSWQNVTPGKGNYLRSLKRSTVSLRINQCYLLRVSR